MLSVLSTIKIKLKKKLSSRIEVTCPKGPGWLQHMLPSIKELLSLARENSHFWFQAWLCLYVAVSHLSYNFPRSVSFFFFDLIFNLFIPKAPRYIVVYSSLWVLLAVACGTLPQRGLMSSAMSAPRMRTNETLGRLQRSART